MYMKSLNETLLVAIVVVTLIPLVVWFNSYKSSLQQTSVASFKCSGSYLSFDEYVKKVSSDAEDFFKKSPMASLGEFTIKNNDKVTNNCKEELRSFRGGIGTLEKEKLRGVVQHALLESNFICPEDYTDSAEYLNNTARFIKEYLGLHPNANVESLLSYRHDLLEANSCKQTLESLDYSEFKLNTLFLPFNFA